MEPLRDMLAAPANHHGRSGASSQRRSWGEILSSVITSRPPVRGSGPLSHSPTFPNIPGDAGESRENRSPPEAWAAAKVCCRRDQARRNQLAPLPPAVHRLRRIAATLPAPEHMDATITQPGLISAP